MKNDTVYIQQILEAIGKIRQFSGGISHADFLKDQKTQSSVLMQLILIGEIAKKICDETKSAIDLPWKEISGFRDRAVHDYFEIDLEVVWNTLQTDIGVVEEKLKKIIG